MSHSSGRRTVSSWVSVRSSVTATAEEARATVRPFRSTIRETTSTSAAAPDVLTTEVSTRTRPRSAEISGVVTRVPQRATCTGSVITRRASRYMPLPEYQRLLGSWFRTLTASTFSVTPSVCTSPVRSKAKPV